MSAKRVGLPLAARNPPASDAPWPPSFQPRNAAISTGARAAGDGRREARRPFRPVYVHPGPDPHADATGAVTKATLASPHRAGERDVHEHEAPGQMRAVHWISPTDHLREQHARAGRAPRETGTARSSRRREEPSRAAPGRSIPKIAVARTWTYTGRVQRPEPAHVRSCRPECGPAAVATAPATTRASAAAGQRRSRPSATHGGDRRAASRVPRHGATATTIAPARHGHREQEVRRDHQRVQAGLDRDQAERRLRERPGEGRRRASQAAPARGMSAPAQGGHGASRPRAPIGNRIATARFENSIAAVVALRGEESCPAQPGPAVAAEARGGEPDDARP